MSMWIPPELMALYYNWKTTMAWPIMINCIAVSSLSLVIMYVQYKRNPKGIINEKET